MVTLPKDWAESHNLKKNDPVAVVAQPDGSLLLTIGGESSVKTSSKVLDIDDFDDPEALYRCLIGAYIAGHDQIILKSGSPIKGSYLEVISEFTQTSMGMEIVEEDEDQIIIKDLIDHSEVIPQKNVRREYILVKRMVGDALSLDHPGMSEMVSRDTEVDRIHWLVQRQASIHQQDVRLCARMGLRPGSVTSCMGVSKILERMGDHAVLIAKNLDTLQSYNRIQLVKGLEAISSILIGYIEKSMSSWQSADNMVAEEVIRCKGDVLRELNGLFAEVFADNEANLLAGSINRIVEYCSDIAESAINLAMESV